MSFSCQKAAETKAIDAASGIALFRGTFDGLGIDGQYMSSY
jgi:hypothetical protein